MCSTGDHSLILTLLCNKGDILQDTYFYHVEEETRHQQSIHTGSYLVRIKVQKHKLDNHQLGYSKFCLSWTGDFSGRTLIVWKCEVTPRSITFKEFQFQCHSDVGGSEVLACPPLYLVKYGGGRSFTFRSDRFMILARHHSNKLCEREKHHELQQLHSRPSVSGLYKVVYLQNQRVHRHLNQHLSGYLLLPSDPPGNKSLVGIHTDLNSLFTPWSRFLPVGPTASSLHPVAQMCLWHHLH